MSRAVTLEPDCRSDSRSESLFCAPAETAAIARQSSRKTAAVPQCRGSAQSDVTSKPVAAVTGEARGTETARKRHRVHARFAPGFRQLSIFCERLSSMPSRQSPSASWPHPPPSAGAIKAHATYDGSRSEHFFFSCFLLLPFSLFVYFLVLLFLFFAVAGPEHTYISMYLLSLRELSCPCT